MGCSLFMVLRATSYRSSAEDMVLVDIGTGTVYEQGQGRGSWVSW